MPLIGVNSVSDAPNRPTTLDRISTGVDIASRILGTGAQLYGSYQKGRETNASIEASQEHTALEEMDRGLMPVSHTLFGKDPDSLTPDQINQHNAAIPKDSLGNPLAPTLVRLTNGKVRAQLPGYGNFSPLDKAITDQLFKQNTLASPNDPHATPTLLPGGRGFYIKPTPLTTAERATTQLAGMKAFSDDQPVKDYNNIYPQAQTAQRVAMKLANGQPVDKVSAIALTGSFLKTFAPEGVRVNPEGILDLQDASQTVKEQVLEKLHNLGLDPTAPITGLSPQAATGMINEIQNREQVARQAYDASYLAHQNYANTNSIPFQVKPAPQLKFPDLSKFQNPNNKLGNAPPSIGDSIAQKIKKGLDYVQDDGQPTPAPAPSVAPHPVDNVLKKYGVNPR